MKYHIQIKNPNGSDTTYSTTTESLERYLEDIKRFVADGAIVEIKQGN